VYDPLGRLKAVLDISALTSPQAKSSQQLALQLVKVYAHRVENANFLRWFRKHWVLKLHPSPEFVEISPDHLLALDAGGRIAGHNRAAQLLLEAEHGGEVLGLPFDRLFNVPFEELGRYVRGMHSGTQRAVTLARSGRVLFLHAVPPPLGWNTASAATAAALPEASVPASLAQLSGGDPALDRQIQRAARLVDTTMSVLITGETGSGKEYLAKAMHQASQRRGKAFVAVNCAAIPETLIESELFGHLPGSFSGATAKGKRGLIQEADGGTLFLDEIGDMPLALQPRLLRVLAEREVLPVGGTRAQKVDVRVISATHADLAALVREGRFRDDLYFRLAGAQLALPPLRERRDLPWLAHRMLHEQPSPPRLSPEVEAWLRAYPWPGNLRELKNVLAYACAMAGPEAVIGLAELPDALVGGDTSAAAPAAAPSSMPPEAQLLLQYLRAADWSVSAVAHQLGVARMTVYRRMQRWGIRQPDRSARDSSE
jgi:sigma-54 dependent transcriptional regulator, acetoin dehydrogenase operon transcriptional activator AcoR